MEVIRIYVNMFPQLNGHTFVLDIFTTRCLGMEDIVKMVVLLNIVVETKH